MIGMPGGALDALGDIPIIQTSAGDAHVNVWQRPVPGRERVVCKRCSKTAQHSTAQQPEMLTSVVGSSLVSGRG
jgi:hypothetical protein